MFTRNYPCLQLLSPIRAFAFLGGVFKTHCSLDIVHQTMFGKHCLGSKELQSNLPIQPDKKISTSTQFAIHNLQMCSTNSLHNFGSFISSLIFLVHIFSRQILSWKFSFEMEISTVQFADLRQIEFAVNCKLCRAYREFFRIESFEFLWIPSEVQNDLNNSPISNPMRYCFRLL